MTRGVIGALDGRVRAIPFRDGQDAGPVRQAAGSYRHNETHSVSPVSQQAAARRRLCEAASGCGDHVDAQRFAACRDFQQTIDIRMGAGTVAGVGGVLGEHGETVLGGLRVERAECQLQVMVDSQRALLARLVFDRRDYRALAVDQIDALDAVDGGQLREVVLEDVTRLDRLCRRGSGHFVHKMPSIIDRHAALSSESGGDMLRNIFRRDHDDR